MHTTGPWMVEVDRFDGAKHVYVAKAEDGKPVGRICEVFENCLVRGRTREDNARLMAASSDLLGEIERQYIELADYRNEWPGRSTPAGQAKLIRMRDLIAKATGRSERDVQDDCGTRAARDAAQSTGSQA